MNWITVREFCEQYGISHQCVYKKIKRWGYKLGDHIYEEYGKSKLLDEEAVVFFVRRTGTAMIVKILWAN